MSQYSEYYIFIVTEERFDVKDFRRWIKKYNNIKSFGGHEIIDYDNWCGPGRIKIEDLDDFTQIIYKEGCYHCELTITIKYGDENDLRFFVEGLQAYSDKIVYIRALGDGNDKITVNKIESNQRMADLKQRYPYAKHLLIF